MHSVITPCAYEPDPGTGPWIEEFQVMTFADQWRTELTDLFALGWRSRDPFAGLPVRKLDNLLRAVAPGILATGRGASADPSVPWLYAREQLPDDVVMPAFLSWVTMLRPENEHRAATRRVFDAIRTTKPEWRKCPVELSGTDVSPGGTALPHQRLYALLPELLALRLAARPFRSEGAGVDQWFRVVRREQGAELVTWPPLPYRKNGLDHHYSALLQITVHNVPFTPSFRVHVSSGIRRWSTRTPIWTPRGRGVTVLFDLPFPWQEDSEARRTRLIGNVMKFSPQDGRYTWRGQSSVEIIGELDIVQRYPKPEEIIASPRDWLRGQGKVAAGVVHSTAMGRHQIGTGLMPGERAHLDAWVADGLRPWFRRTSPLERVSRISKPVLLPKVPKTDTARRAQVDSQAVCARRAALRAALAGKPLTIEIVTLYPETQEHLVHQLAVLLGVAAEDSGNGSVRHWSVDGLEIELSLSDAGSLGDALTAPPEVKSKDARASETLRARRAAVAARFPRRTGRAGLALVEIPGADRFTEPDSDPKFALRLGFADTGRVSQFVQVSDDHTADPAIRAESACLDGLRQLGASSVPEHRAGAEIPADLQYVALWAVRKQATALTKRASRHLVAVRIRPAAPEHPVEGWDDDARAWIPYSDLLVSLAAGNDLDTDGPRKDGRDTFSTAEDERADIERRIRAILFQARDRPTLLFVNAGNLRDSWRWLGNRTLVKDKLGFTGEPDQRLGAFGEHLRIVLLRDRNSREEVPQWYAPGKDSETPGFSLGLWASQDAPPGNRVFASTADVPKNFPKVPRGLRKIGREPNGSSSPTVPAWNPQYLELTLLGCRAEDDPAVWAALSHQLRFHDDYVPLARPLPMHLAKLADEYLNPLPAERVSPEETGP
ncbi:pPIWI_RE module domain-containing protein [Amycolatopsis sp. cmx-11-12]|uniref:pPIWI_RE module domain-containing protein n=1 Tax=Amycolatopsis sp. cmx-11-12 TaxID=2785795 RepID=UPI0039182BD0